MSKKIIFLFLFLLFLIEGFILQLLIGDDFSSHIYTYPLLVLTFIIFLAVFGNKKDSLIMGLIFGLLYDIIYGRVFGVYTFGILGTIYSIKWFIQYFHPTFILYLIIEAVGLSLFEIFLYGFLSLFELIQVPLTFVLSNILFPTILFNLVFAGIYYLVFKKIIEKDTV